MSRSAPTATGRDPFTQWKLAPYHLGSLIGPYNGGGFPIVFPILQGVFHVDRATLSVIVPAYFVTFGICQFFSGTISDLTSRRGTILAGFATFGGAALMCAVAPSLPIFVLGCILLGVTNAFTTPILLATLGDTLPPSRLPRTVAVFSAANQTGHLLGPLVAGLLVAWSWRLFFVSVALLSWLAGGWLFFWFRRYGALVPERPRVVSVAESLRALVRALDRAVAQVVALAFVTNAAVMGTAYLLGQALRDLWGLDYATIGLVVSLYGLGAILFGPPAGYLLERFGAQRGAAIGLLAVSLAIAAMALAPRPWIFAAAYLSLGLAAMLTWTAFSTLAVQAAPTHRGTASAYFLGARFLVQGLAPALYTPTYGALGPRAVFALSAAIALGALVPLRLLRPRGPSAVSLASADDD
ncbi:MAG: MFS transporter [Thermomicrobium sp.]|nr:MFS transporter [Thermomicrobium sp.]